MRIVESGDEVVLNDFESEQLRLWVIEEIKTTYEFWLGVNGITWKVKK